jgi:phosphopantetheine adenylyltransferase
MSYKWLSIMGLALAIVLAGCATTDSSSDAAVEEAALEETAVAESEPEFDMAPHEKEGFTLIEEEGRLWVFRKDSADLAKFLAEGEPAKQVIRPVAGVNGVTLKSTESETIDEYITTLPGWATIMEDGRLWVFRAKSEELAQFIEEGEPAKQVVRPLAGPYGMTLKGVSGEDLDAYMADWESR